MREKYNMELKTSENGHLSDLNDWNIDVASILAKTENIELNDERWTIINFMRDFYIKYKTSPNMRVLIKGLKSQGTEASSIYLYKLFPDSPIKKASKIAGLPRPKTCM